MSELLGKRRRAVVSKLSLDDHVSLEDACRALQDSVDVQALRNHVDTWTGSAQDFEAVKQWVDAAHASLLSFDDKSLAISLNKQLERIGYVCGGIIREDHQLR